MRTRRTTRRALVLVRHGIRVGRADFDRALAEAGSEGSPPCVSLFYVIDTVQCAFYSLIISIFALLDVWEFDTFGLFGIK